MSNVLNQGVRDIIRSEAFARAFDERRESIAVEGQALAAKIHESLFGEYMSLLDQIPNFFKIMTTEVRFRITAKGSEYGLRSENPLPGRGVVGLRDVNKVKDNDVSLVIKDKKLANQVKRHIEKRGSLDKEVREFAFSIGIILNKATSKKKLLEMWPEAEELWPVEQKKPDAKPPEKDNKDKIDSLNKSLGFGRRGKKKPAQKAATKK